MTSPVQQKRPAPDANRSGHSFKALLAASSLAAALGGWAWLSADRVPIKATEFTASLPPPSATQDTAFQMPPLPTLVPPPAGGPPLPTMSPVTLQPPPNPTLRVVNEVPAQRVVHVGGGGGGGGGNGGGGGGAPAAQTSSSR